MRDDNEALRRKIKPGGLGISKIWYEIKARAKVAYRLWMHSPLHPSLQFKKTGTVWSVRIGAGYRALAVLDETTLHWFWIGAHDEYERLLSLS